MVGGKTALSRKFFRFAEGTEQPVPPGYVTVIVLVNVELMVDGVVFGPLYKVSDPAIISSWLNRSYS